MGPTFYIHVRQHARAIAFAVIGPYLSQADAERAAEFAKLSHWTVEQRNHGALKLF